MRIRRPVVLSSLLLLGLVAGTARAKDGVPVRDGAGLYRLPSGGTLTLAYWGGYYLIDTRSGEARHLTYVRDTTYTFGPARSLDEPVAGTVILDRSAAGPGERLHLIAGDAVERVAERVPLRVSEHRFANGDQASLAGSLVLPVNGRPLAVAVLLAGEGPNPRTDLSPLAMELADHQFGAFVFDQRNAGDSTGVEVHGNYHVRSLAAASDAVAAVRYVLGLHELAGLPVGVAGHSQGGWIGARVAAEVPEVAFYVNSAGNGSPAWKQWWHAMESWLRRQEVPEAEVEKAEAYFDVFFDIYHGSAPWDDYVAALDRARASAWWPVLRRRYVAEWESEEEATEFAAAERENFPEGDFARVHCPALGIFAAFDGSSTPETPEVFVRGLRRGGNGDVTVKVIPDVNHGMWLVGGYRTPTSAIERQSPEWQKTIREWILSVVSRPSAGNAFDGE